MSNKQMTQLDPKELEAVVSAYIERETQDMGEIEAPLFYEALEEIFADEATTETIELEGRIVDSQLQLHPISREMTGVLIHDNEILVKHFRFVIRLEAAES